MAMIEEGEGTNNLDGAGAATLHIFINTKQIAMA